MFRHSMNVNRPSSLDEMGMSERQGRSVGVPDMGKSVDTRMQVEVGSSLQIPRTMSSRSPFHPLHVILFPSVHVFILFLFLLGRTCGTEVGGGEEQNYSQVTKCDMRSTAEQIRDPTSSRQELPRCLIILGEKWTFE